MTRETRIEESVDSFKKIQISVCRRKVVFFNLWCSLLSFMLFVLCLLLTTYVLSSLWFVVFSCVAGLYVCKRGCTHMYQNLLVMLDFKLTPVSRIDQ